MRERGEFLHKPRKSRGIGDREELTPMMLRLWGYLLGCLETSRFSGVVTSSGNMGKTWAGELGKQECIGLPGGTSAMATAVGLAVGSDNMSGNQPKALCKRKPKAFCE